MRKIKMDECGIITNEQCPKLEKTCKCSECEYYCDNGMPDHFVYCLFPGKMTFFEAWEKAEDGDKVKYRKGDGCEFTKDNGARDCLMDSNTSPFICWFFEKEWTIIPEKETVVIDIPENATNICVSDTRNTITYKV